MELFGMDEVKQLINTQKTFFNEKVHTNFGIKIGNNIMKFFDLRVQIEKAPALNSYQMNIDVDSESIQKITFTQNLVEKDIYTYEYPDLIDFFDQAIQMYEKHNHINFTGVDFAFLRTFLMRIFFEVVKINIVLSSGVLKPGYTISPLIEKIRGLKPNQKEFLNWEIDEKGLMKHSLDRVFTKDEKLQLAGISVLAVKEHYTKLGEYLVAKGVISDLSNI
jgi:hypothetical protein